jgi:anionic cell wall polymer biosynthesis LytR-Cps2A-Psr (LCP) family protein
MSAVVLVVSGSAQRYVHELGSLGQGVALPGSPSVGAMNILVMGLESRTDYEGNYLDHHLAHVLHTGTNNGSQDTNTLMLIHVFANGQKAVGFSIPRDSLVNFPQAYDGLSAGKIDAPYAFAYDQYYNENAGKEDRGHLYLGANQAGQGAEIATVESLTGVQVNHFVEVNLEGFYYLADAFRGIEVCIKPAPAQGGFAAGANLTDQDPLTGTDNSGFDAYTDGYNLKKGGAQYLSLNAAQSLAFVRSRDTLPGTDVGRTYRQQATLDYVMWKVKHDNILANVGLLNSLLGTASKYLITDPDFNVLDFATELQALRGENMHLTTLPGTAVNNVPVAGYKDPQDVIEVNVPQIQHLVKSAFAGQAVAKSAVKAAGKHPQAALAPAKVTVDVYNGSTATAAPLAGQTSAALVALGYKAGKVANATTQPEPVQVGTQVFYGAGAGADAAELAPQFGAKAVALKALPPDHIEVLIGSSVTTVPAGLTPAATATAATQSVSARLFDAAGAQADKPAKSSAGAATSSPGPALGDSSAVKPNAPYGVPCVY